MRPYMYTFLYKHTHTTIVLPLLPYLKLKSDVVHAINFSLELTRHGKSY